MPSFRGHILGAMRLAALLMAIVVGAAPAALTACEIVCASVPVESAAAPSAHSCHGTTHTEGLSMAAGTHACGHEEAMPPAGKIPPPDVAVSPGMSVSLPAQGVSTRVIDAFTRSAAPGRLQSPLALRI